MNADDPRGGHVAELARLLPAPAEREFPAARQQTLKEHLMSELRLAGRPPGGQARQAPSPQAGHPHRRRHRRRPGRRHRRDPPAPEHPRFLTGRHPAAGQDRNRRRPAAEPTDPLALLNLIKQQMQGQLPVPEEAFTTIGDLLREAIAPPRVSAALYRAAALIPGVTMVADATDAIGRHGVAVAMTYQGARSEWIFSKQTLLYLGERDIEIAGGSTTGVSAVLLRAFVNHAGQIPGQRQGS